MLYNYAHIVTECLLCPRIFTIATVVNILEQLSSIKKSLCCTRNNNETACVDIFILNLNEGMNWKS
jgi:hypothetical protein